MIRAPAAMIGAVICATTGLAHADSRTEMQRADALFEEGKAQRGQGHYAAACADFEQSRRLDDGIGVTLYLADCYEQSGDRARALAEFRRAEALADARGDARAAVARRRADAIDPATSAPAREATPHAVDPPAVPSPSSDDAIAKTRTTRHMIGAGLGGAGIIGIGVGATFGVIALSALSRSNDGPCTPDDHCTPTGLALRHQSADAATVSTIGFVAGAALLGGGVAVYLSAPRGGENVALSPMVVGGGAGALLRGRF